MGEIKKEFQFQIDGKDVKGFEGENVLDVARREDIFIPSFSYDARIDSLKDTLGIVKLNGGTEFIGAEEIKVDESVSSVITNSEDIRLEQCRVVQQKLDKHYGDCYPPCQTACPCQIPCADFIKLTQEGRYDEALFAVMDRNPFALVCGTVCPRFCEQGCRRHALDEPVAINDVKRFLSEWNTKYNHDIKIPVLPSTGKKVAVIGAGPAGIANAHFLAKQGHAVTIYEAMPKHGGMLRYGIPEYRLPKKDVDTEIDFICTKLGVVIEYNKKFGVDITVESLKKAGFDMVFLAIGAWDPMPLRIPGTDAPGVLTGVDFLKRVALGEKVKVGKTVVVVGGGNVSMDVARTCIRLGAKDVTLTCILKESDMPALPIEIKEFREEGGKIDCLSQPIEVVKDNKGRMNGVHYRKRPITADIFDFGINIPGTDYTMKCDSLIVAIGQVMQTKEVEEQKVPLTKRRFVDAAANGEVAGFDGFVWAGGDCTLTPVTVVEAVCSARTAAEHMHAKLMGIAPPAADFSYLHTRGTNEEMLASRENENPKRIPYYKDTPLSHRTDMPHLKPKERIHNFKQVQWVAPEKDILDETSRCLQCGCGSAVTCELRKVASFLNIDNRANVPKEPTKINDNNPFFVRDQGKCIECEKCIRVCKDIRNVVAIEDFPSFNWNNVDTNYTKGNPDPRVCDSCGTCLANCPTNALFPKRKELVPDNCVKTTCSYCGVGCGLEINTRHGKIVSVDGVEDHPASHGEFCVKGRFGNDFTQSKERITTPMIRKTKGGKLEPATWDQALSLAAQKLGEIKEAHGADSIAGFASAKVTNEENFLFMKFMRAVIGTNNVDHCARLCHASTVAGLAVAFGSGAMTNSCDELEHSDCVFVTGSNTTETHPVLGNRLKKASRKGCKIIIADPRRINLAEYAHLHVAQRSGTDVMLFNAMMSVIIKEELYDKKFIEEKCENFDKFKEEILKYSPEEAEPVCGIPAADIREMALTYAKAEKASIVFSMGITQHSTGTDNVLSLANLAMLTGNMGKYATGVNPLRGQNNVQGACDMGALPVVYSGYQKVIDENARAKFSKAWGREMPPKPGHTITTAINAAYDGDVKAIYIMGENPAMSDPNLNHARDALAKLDFLVVQDIFMTSTAEYADVILPATSFIEKTGSFTNTERRALRVNPVVPALKGCRQDWEIIVELGKRLGYEMDYPNGCKSILEEINKVTPSYGGITNERIDVRGLQWPCPNTDHPGTMFLHKDGNFARGKGLFSAVPFKEPAELPDEEYPLVLTTGRVLYHFHTGTMSRKTEGLNKICPTTHVELHAEDAEKYGIADGDNVEVVTRRGKAKGIACVPSRVKRGVVFAPFHYSEGPINMCTNDALDPIAKIPEFKACACKIVKV